tara:strand:- start:3063 stop:3458 length:396 start_codon:yes stop_codon:yes gene_type:complete
LICKTCKTEKVETDFYLSNKSHCKECLKARARATRAKRINYYRAYDRDRGNRQPKKYLKEYRKQNRNKYTAHNKVNNAIRDGKLKREPCEKCGANKVHAHHDDYAKPLEIRWLCPAHHQQWHATNGEALNP